MKDTLKDQKKQKSSRQEKIAILENRFSNFVYFYMFFGIFAVLFPLIFAEIFFVFATGFAISTIIFYIYFDWFVENAYYE